MKNSNLKHLRTAVCLVIFSSAEGFAYAQEERSPLLPDTVTFSVIGGSPNLQTGFDLGYMISEKDSISATYVYNMRLMSEDRSSMAAVKWKHFWGNTFYTNLGLGYLSSQWREDFGGASADAHMVDLAESSIALNVAVGNRWEWQSGFLLGCDWVALDVPIYRIDGPYSVDKDSYDAEWYTDGMNERKNDRPTSQLSLAKLYAGWKF
jgi:hypothetical protein